MPNAGAVAARIDAIPGDRRQFKRAFGGRRPVTFDHVAQAIATYERTLITPDSPFDRYAREGPQRHKTGGAQGLHGRAGVGLYRMS